MGQMLVKCLNVPHPWNMLCRNLRTFIWKRHLDCYTRQVIYCALFSNNWGKIVTCLGHVENVHAQVFCVLKHFAPTKGCLALETGIQQALPHLRSVDITLTIAALRRKGCVRRVRKGQLIRYKCASFEEFYGTYSNLQPVVCKKVKSK